MPPSPPFTSDLEIFAIGEGLRDRTLPKSAWTHRAHFAAALWLLALQPEADAASVMPPLIRAYNEATGVANTASSGYHETITMASARAARAFLTERSYLPLYAVCNELLASPLGDSGWLLTYWSRTLLFSTEARVVWMEPDLRPFPYP
ncbi:MAG TPA: hypothetical protein VGN16_06610 [Acidobacteriaceae bacterium]|jgi:hypothetical protein